MKVLYNFRRKSVEEYSNHHHVIIMSPTVIHVLFMKIYIFVSFIAKHNQATDFFLVLAQDYVSDLQVP